jgi:DNA invertase Pin-like site-specific DNA recombinase
MAAKTSKQPTQVLAYLRVSTGEQGRSGLGLEAQREAIETAAQQRGWNVVDWITDTASGKSLKRPGIQQALTRLENGGPKVLVVAKLDRLARSAIDFLGVVERAEKNGWSLILLEPNVDMTDPMGRFTASILASVAQLEREMISQRTKAALSQAKRDGKRLGTRVNIPRRVVDRIREEREAGHSLQRIADGLNADQVPTARGGEWWPSTVSYVLRSDRSDWPERRVRTETKGEDTDHE